jgi:hypothetical protein
MKIPYDKTRYVPPTSTTFKPRRGRRLNAKAFKSVFRYPKVEPEFKWFLDRASTAAALGVSLWTLKQWAKSWPSGKCTGPEPVRSGPSGKNTLRYRWDDVTKRSFIREMRNRRRELVMATAGPLPAKAWSTHSGKVLGTPRTMDERFQPAKYAAMDAEVAEAGTN